MDKETYRQIDRIEAKLDFLIEKLVPQEEEEHKEV
jgi:hypothetical protein